MKEIYGIDMEANGQYSKLITDIPDVDIAISMGCNVGCPFIGRAFDDNWGLDDPTGKSDDDFKMCIRDRCSSQFIVWEIPWILPIWYCFFVLKKQALLQVKISVLTVV